MTEDKSVRRAPCGTCGNEYTVTAKGGMRHHFTENPDFQAGPDSRTCKGVGQPPADPAGVALAEDMETQPQCRLCKHPVQLTGNGRARSHLTPEATPRPCPGGSDFPLGTYPEIVGTTDGLVASLARDCEHREIGTCYDCAGVPVPGELTGSGDVLAERPTAPWGVNEDTVEQPTMADQLKASPLTRSLAQETAGVGTALDAMLADDRTEAERFMAAGIPEQSPQRDPRCGDCDTDNHRCKGCGTDVPHGTVACTDCDRRVTANRLPKGETEDGRPCFHDDAVFGVEDDRMVCVACGTPCTHPDGFQVANEDLDDDGQGAQTFTCALCGAPEPGDVECTHERYKNFGPKAGVRCVACNAKHPDPHAYEADIAIATVEAERAEEDRQYHQTINEELTRQRDGWRTPADMLAKMPEDVRGLDALRLDCATCGHPVTPRGDQFDMYGTPKVVMWGCREGFHSGYRVCRDHECVPNRDVRLGDLDEGDYFTRRGTLMRLTERESATVVLAEVMDGPHKGRTGELKNPDEIVERAAEPQVETPQESEAAAPAPATQERQQSGPALLGHLGVGEHFIRRGTLMRVTGEVNGAVQAVVVGGPHDGRTGELPNLGETVERIPAPGITESETTECTDATTLARQPGSSAASTPTTTSPTTAPDPGSPRATRASAQAVSPESGSVTSSAPTAKAAGRGGSAAVTTDQAQADEAAAFFGTGRSAAPAGAQSQAEQAAQFFAGSSGAHGEKETKRDRFGRYLIPHPDTGKEQAWTRATTFAKSISDTFALSQWGLRMALLGATMRPDIVRRAHGKHVRADKKLLDELTAELKTAAGDKVAANDGTAMHSFTEMADRAWHTPGGPRSVMDQVPPDCREMVETYIRLLEETGLEPVPHLIEFTTVVKQYGVAGTSDNCYRVTRPLTMRIGRAEVQFSPGEYVIGDKKTGRDLDYGWQEIAIQLGTYAQGINTSGVWDRHEEKWYPDPLNGAKVRTDAGVVIHLPVDKESEKTPTVYGLDLESGWNAAVLCDRVRAWRKVRNLASPVMVSETGADSPGPRQAQPVMTSRTTVRPPSLKDRASAVTSKTEASAVWQDARTAGLSDGEVDVLVKVMQDRLKKLAEPAG